MKKYFFSALILSFSASALASPTVSNFQSCMNNADSNMAMEQCASDELKRVDVQLNVFYRQLTSEIKISDKQAANMGPPVNGVALLVANEKAWITFRDSTCNLSDAQLQGGSGTGLADLQCQIDETNIRITKLQSLIKDWAPAGR